MAGKRGNSEGSIRKRGDERWEARYMGADGIRHSLYRKTRQEAARALMEALREREQGLPVPLKRQTIGEYLSFWLETVKRYDVDPSSFVRYRYNVNFHLVPALGDLGLTKVTAQHLQALYAQKLAEGYAASTVQHLHITLHDALEHALKVGLVVRNVASLATPPRVKRKEMEVLSEAQARQLLAQVRGHRLEALVTLALATGVREGELIALRWADVDLDQANLQIRQTLQRGFEGLTIGEAKTTHSRRSIAIPGSVVDALRAHRQVQVEERLRLGAAWQNLGLVFCNEAGGRLSASLFRRRGWFGRVLRQACLPLVRFHDLRHTAATLLLARGVNPKVVSEMLGHSSVAITLSLYGHVTPHMQREAAKTMDALLMGEMA